MPLNIVPANSAPNLLQNSQAAASAPKVMSSRDRAIARLTGKDPDAAPAAQAADPAASVTAVADALPAAVAASQTTPKNTSEAPASAQATPAVAPAESTTEEPLTAQFAILSRKEKALRAKVAQQDATIKAREDALKAKEAEIAAREAEYNSKYIPKDKFSPATALQTLQELGYSYDQLTALAMGQQNTATQAPQSDQETYKRLRDEIKAELQAELKPVKEAQEKVRQDYENNQKAAYTQAIAQIKADAKRLITADPSFEALAQEGDSGIDEVAKLIETTFHEGLGDGMPKGTVLRVEDAAQMIEDELVDRYLKAAKLKKIQAKLGVTTPAASATAAAPAADKTSAVAAPMTTLTNAAPATKPLSRRERAIAAFEGRLK